MSRFSRFGILTVSLFVLAAVLRGFAADPDPQQQPPAPDSASSPPSQAPQQAVVQKTQAPPPQDPYILEDGGFSLEPLYWFSRAQPFLRGGKAAASYENLAYPGHSKAALGGELAIPAGRANTLRLSYFRIQGNSNPTVWQDATLFGESFAAGTYLNAGYRIQNAKISWDYLSYTWQKSKLRLKTLYEVQYTTISTTIDAPFLAPTTDSSGNTDYHSANGSKNVIYPTLGIGFEQAKGKHFRWEIKGSGFGLPHRSTIWDAQADIALRYGSVELLAGGKAFHFKSSPQGEQYFSDTLSGAFAGLRYYWGRQQ